MLNTIDLFAGCGGLTDGFKQSGEFKLLAGVEWDKHAIHTLRQRLSTRWNYSAQTAKPPKVKSASPS